MEGEKSGLKIFLFVEHEIMDPSHSIYLIEPSLKGIEEMDSDGFAVDSISPIKTLQRDDCCCFISDSAMCRLGSCFYFFGGETFSYLYSRKNSRVITDELKLRVQVFNIEYPNLGFCKVASLNAPKETPCVFSVKGLIYALGSSLSGCNYKGGRTGIFERYHPERDYWEVLPDPPKPFGERIDMNWCDTATVVRDRYIYLGNTIHELYLVFDLDKEKWMSFPKSSPLSTRFPYGSIYVDDSLYYLNGIGSWKLGTEFDVDDNTDDNDVKLVKTSPLPHVDEDDPFMLLSSLCLDPANQRIMSTFNQLEGDTWFSDLDFSQWRDIFHLGDHFFCYVSTSHLVDQHDLQKPTQPYCRGVWIKVFEEVVPDRNSTTKQPRFRTLASFSYRITTPFYNYSSFIRCSAFGPVPASWVKAPLSKKQVAAKEREDCKAEQSQHECGGRSEGQRDGGWSEGQVDVYLQMILADENSRLKAELAKKDDLLKQYELFLAQSGAKLPLTVLNCGPGVYHTITQGGHGSSEAALWTVELLPPDHNIDRLKSCYNKYLTTSNLPFLYGMRHRKLLQSIPNMLDSSVEWEPIRDGVNYQVGHQKTQHHHRPFHLRPPPCHGAVRLSDRDRRFPAFFPPLSPVPTRNAAVPAVRACRLFLSPIAQPPPPDSTATAVSASHRQGCVISAPSEHVDKTVEERRRYNRVAIKVNRLVNRCIGIEATSIGETYLRSSECEEARCDW
ncbi:hypothetical protein POM88_052312 [Heracleum sosnowskyi]|uniref:DUF569 domain-containing protein n=1 Tax=Heracleum sosnowskyi TaxID=360622 RepID=A0AAD8LYJ8_9APIA|nr:hypothetical protein POM88_052312 [Heracleum sosnowskyi]